MKIDQENYYNIFRESWLLVSKPSIVVYGVLAYSILALKVGPALMKGRRPLKTKIVEVIYCLVQILLSTFLILLFSKTKFPRRLDDPCPSTLMNGSFNAVYITIGLWYYAIAKSLELLDTVFLVANKRQVTLLHVYQQGMMALVAWAYLKYGVDYQGCAMVMINSMVNVAVYLIRMVGPEFNKSIAALRMIQFCLMISYLVIIKTKNCQTNAFASNLLLVNYSIFLLLIIFCTKKNAKQQ